jgi:hypothetical protein
LGVCTLSGGLAQDTKDGLQGGVAVLVVAVVLIVVMVVVTLILVVLLHLWRKRKLGSLTTDSVEVLMEIVY